MRINIVHMGFLYSGGGERVVLEQASRLRKRGHSVKVFTPIIRWEKCYPHMLRNVQPERVVPPFPLPFPFREASAMVASAVLPFRMREMADCDVLLCHSQPSMWIGYRSQALFGTPYVGYLHQLTTFIHKRPSEAGNWASQGDFLFLDGLLGVFGRRLATHLDRLCHSKAARLLFNSAWTRDLFRKEYGLSGAVCHPAIGARPRLQESKHGNTVITASRHYPWKRIDLAFHVLKHLRSIHPRFLVTGEETSHTRTLKDIVDHLGISDSVKFTGFVSDARLNSFYSKAGAYVQTSIFEPFGLGPLEAQSYGAPAIVWGDAGARETVIDGETGFHATPYDLNDYAQKLELILTDDKKRREMSRSARNWAGTFDWETHVDILEGVLDAERR